MALFRRLLSAFAVFAIASSGRAAAQTASPSPPPWPGLDPFCAVRVFAVPWNRTTRSLPPGDAGDSLMLVVYLESHSAATVDAEVTLIGDTDAYGVSLRKVPVFGRVDRWFSPTLVIELPKPLAIRYAYVVSYRVGGGSETICPTEPAEVRPWGKPVRLPWARSDSLMFVASFKQVLPPLPCGHVYTEARVESVSQPAGIKTLKRRTALIQIFLDSDGHLLRASLYKSSGVDYADQRALASAELSSYRPATFLCVPIVSTYLFRVDFAP